MEETKGIQDRQVITWLLESENPAIRYKAMTALLDRSEGDAEVIAARSAIPIYPPIAALLAAQNPAGYWVKPDYYLPKNYSTFCVLTVLADLGLTNENEHIRRGCEYLFTFQREDGQFCRRRRVAGQGLAWEARAEPCTHARIVRLLLQFGYAQDARTRRAIDWLLATQRPDAMWLCAWAKHGAGCLRATLDYLRAAVLDAPTTALPATASAAAVVCNLLMQPGMGRYHVGDAWNCLVYPFFGYGIIPALDALARLGYSTSHPKIAGALDFLLSRRLPDGSWPLDEAVSRPPLDFGVPGFPNPWLTLEALQVLKRLDIFK